MDSILCCGFEEGVFGPHWTTVAPAVTITATNPISGARSLQSNVTNQSNAHAQSVQSFGAGLIVARFRVRFVTIPVNVDDQILCIAGDSATGVRLMPAGIMALCNGFGGQGVIPVSVGIVYCIDCKIDRRANPWTVDVQVNGVSVGQAQSATAADTSAQQLRLGWQGGVSFVGDMLIDDVSVSATAADYPIGPGYVHHFVPTADGTHNIAGAADFKRGAAGTDILNATTDSYLLIDDVPMSAVGAAPPTDDYINAIAPPNATDYTEHVFGPAPGIATPTVAPRAVEVIVETAQAATQTGSFKVNLNDNGTVDTVKEQVGVAGVVNVAAARKHYALAPTGGAWVVGGGGDGDFNDLRLRFYSADAAPDQYLVAAMIEAEFKGPLFTKQALQIGDVVEVADEHKDVPAATTYDLGTDITETASTVVTTVVSTSTAEGEVPQQQCVLESQGGGVIGTATVDPKQKIHARMSVTVAGTDAGMSGTAS